MNKICAHKLVRDFSFIAYDTKNSVILIFLLKHLIALEEDLVKYFLDLNISKYDRVNDLFDRNISFTECSHEEEEKLAER